MTGRDRTSIFEDDDDFDVRDFQPGKAPARPAASPDAVRRITEANNFQSREAAVPRAQRRYRTGRNVQLNMKVTPETLALFNRICDEQGWVQGEALDHAIAALQRQLNER